MMRALFCLNESVPGARAQQLAEVFAALGLRMDLVLIGAPGCAKTLPAADRLVHIESASDPDWPWLLNKITEDLDYRLICGVGAACARLLPAGSAYFRLWDALMAGPTAPRADMVLNGTLTSNHSGAGQVIFPLPWPRHGGPVRLQSAALGWAGAWPDGLSEGWSALLADIAQHADRPEQEVILAGPGAERVELPPELSGIAVRPEPERIAPARRCLGAAILPVPPVMAVEGDIAHFLAAGTPVLTLAASAETLQNWHLPTCASMETLRETYFAYRLEPSFRRSLGAKARRTAGVWQALAKTAPDRLRRELSFALGL